jgi:hypothetical protein
LPDFDQVTVCALHQAVEHFDHVQVKDLAFLKAVAFLQPIFPHSSAVFGS